MTHKEIAEQTLRFDAADRQAAERLAGWVKFWEIFFVTASYLGVAFVGFVLGLAL